MAGSLYYINLIWYASLNEITLSYYFSSVSDLTFEFYALLLIQ